MSSARVLLHTRQVEYKGYRRSDGLWEIEAELRDQRAYETLVPEIGLLPPGEFVHRMIVTAVLDDRLIVKDIATSMPATPFRICREIEASLKSIVGVQMGPGWSRAVKEQLGGVRSCTHLRELLVNMATAALQTIPVWHTQQLKRQGRAVLPADKPPPHLGQCHALRFNGPIVREYFPQFHISKEE
jgi:hypothetical protein